MVRVGWMGLGRWLGDCVLGVYMVHIKITLLKFMKISGTQEL